MEGVSGSASQERGSKKNSFEDLSRDELINKCKGFLTLAQKAKQAKNDMLNEIESYKLQLEKCETEKKSSQENVIALQEIVDSLTEQKLKFTTDIHTAHKQIEILNSKFENYNEKINTYKAQLIVKDNQISDIEKKLSDLDSETISLKRQNKRLLDENEQLISQLTEMETRTLEVNNIGLQQKEQLQVLEQHIQSENSYKIKIEELNSKIIELEGKIQTTMKVTDYDSKLEELTKLYETEKAKKEKANVKLKSYKDKILKCAGCINQLKNSRFILAKTVKEYSENIPKWQNDIIRASKILEDQINQLSNENMVLKEKMQQFYNEVKPNEEIDLLNSEITQLRNENELLKHDLAGKQNEVQSIINRNQTISNELSDLKIKYKQVNENLLPEQTNANYLLKEELHTMNQKIITMTNEIAQLEKTITELSTINENLKENSKGDNVIESLNLQIKALESEKAILVKEKLNARDNVMDLEQQNKLLIEQINQTKSEITRLENQSHEKLVSEENYKKEKEAEINSLKYSLTTLQEQFDVLKKEHDDLGDLNSLLKEEVDTLKLSLEQPKDDAENLTDLNVSLQADIVKLETKLSAYKQENASLLLEIKEARAKVSDFDSIMAEYDEAKSKLAGYKTENTELLNEMKEINQVLKERGEAISKLQKAIFEMERLIETLEKDSESAKEEKEEMLKRINSLENNLKTEQTQTEKDNSMRILAEKEMLISSLRDEIERLKVQQSTVDLPNEDNMSTSTLSKADEHSRMKDLDETFEDKYSKLRIFALKLKKKLNETTSQLQRTEQDKIKLEKLLNENAATDHKSTVTSTNDHGDTVQVDDENKKTVAELEGQVKSLSAAAEESQKLVAEIESLKGELLNKSQELVNEVEAHKNTKENLEKARRDVKKKNVLSLEMEDYERSMKELTAKMEENKKKMVQMESTIDTQEGTITAMKTQIKLLEEQIRTEEAQNRTIKEELHHILEDSREKDHVLQTKNSIISKLEQDLENEKRKNEDADLEMTSLMSDKEKIIIALGEEKLELNNKLKKAEFKCSELNEKLRIINIELADLKTEYTSYKVRAQAVLRQNQTVDHSQEEQLKEETAVLKAQIETLNAKLATLQEECSMQTAEAEACRRRAAEAGGEAARAGGRTARLQADLARLAAQLDSERAQHKLQVSTLTQCYKSQIKDLEATLQKETEALRKQLILAQETVKVANVGSLDEANHNQYLVPVIPKDDSDGDEDINVSMIPREEGEGSESAPSPPLSKSFLSGGRRSPVPLDRLLEEGVPEDEALDTAALSLTPEQEVADLRRKLQVQVQRVAHVTVLLSESERDCARLGQLADLLKAELRRVRGAAASPHNTEYMKNVTFKFLTLPPGDERGRLVPVLQKILTLTADETQKIQAIAKGLDPNPSKGWGSYLPWPGGK